MALLVGGGKFSNVQEQSTQGGNDIASDTGETHSSYYRRAPRLNVLMSKHVGLLLLNVYFDSCRSRQTT